MPRLKIKIKMIILFYLIYCYNYSFIFKTDGMSHDHILICGVLCHQICYKSRRKCEEGSDIYCEHDLNQIEAHIYFKIFNKNTGSNF